MVAGPCCRTCGSADRVYPSDQEFLRVADDVWVVQVSFLFTCYRVRDELVHDWEFEFYHDEYDEEQCEVVAAVADGEWV